MIYDKKGVYTNLHDHANGGHGSKKVLNYKLN